MIQKQRKYQSFIIISIAGIIFLVYAYWQYLHNKEVIASIGQFEITKTEFEREIIYRGGEHPQQVNKKQLLDEMITKRLLLNKAYALELPETESIQREYFHLLIAKVREEYIQKERQKIRLSEEEMKDFYQVNKEKYSIAIKRQFAILFFKKRLKDKRKEKKRILEKFSEIMLLDKKGLLKDKNNGFGSSAIDYSEHQVSRYKGGELGWFSKGKDVNWEQEVLDKGFSLLNIGDISPMVETKRGYYLVRLMAEKKAKYLAYDKVKSKIRQQLILKRQQEIKENFDKCLRVEFKVKIDFDKLKEYQKSTQIIKEKRPPMGLI